MSKPKLLFTVSAEYLLRATRNKATELQCALISTECILLALLDMKNSVVYQALEKLHVDIRELGVRLRWDLPMNDRGPGRPPWTPRAKAVTTTCAMCEATARGARKISMEDIIIALSKHRDAAAKEILDNWVSAEQLSQCLYPM